MARINATQMGIMGAFLGGLNFALSSELQRIKDEADLAKERRLVAIRAEEEVRANQEWTRRQQIENKHQLTRDELNDLRQQRLVGMQQGFQSDQKTLDRIHDLEMVGAREDSDVRILGEKERSERRAHAWETTYNRVMDREMPATGGKGVLGSDGKTYPYGTPLPAGVRPAGGYGISWAPSESKSNPTRATHRGARVGEAASATAPQSAPPGYTIIGRTPEGRPVYRGPDGQTYTDD